MHSPILRQDARKCNQSQTDKSLIPFSSSRLKVLHLVVNEYTRLKRVALQAALLGYWIKRRDQCVSRRRIFAETGLKTLRVLNPARGNHFLPLVPFQGGGVGVSSLSNESKTQGTRCDRLSRVKDPTATR